MRHRGRSRPSDRGERMWERRDISKLEGSRVVGWFGREQCPMPSSAGSSQSGKGWQGTPERAAGLAVCEVTRRATHLTARMGEWEARVETGFARSLNPPEGRPHFSGQQPVAGSERRLTLDK